MKYATGEGQNSVTTGGQYCITKHKYPKLTLNMRNGYVIIICMKDKRKISLNGDAIRMRVIIIVEPDENGYHAYCPALKGLHVGGNTEKEALQNAKDAAIAYLRSLIKHGDPIPIGVLEFRRTSKTTFRSLHRTHRHIEDLAVATT